MAADQGDADAQLQIGLMYANGVRLLNDYTKAVEYLRKAADQGKARAQGSLGFMYATGLGVPRDTVEAVKLFGKAAIQDDFAARMNLAFMYENGVGVSGDGSEALKLRYADRLGGDRTIDYLSPKPVSSSGYFQDNIRLFYVKGERNGLTIDSSGAAQWYRKAADQGDAKAQLQLGVMYANGEGVLKDYTEAFVWIKQSAEQGCLDAQVQLGLIYANGDAATKDDIVSPSSISSAPSSYAVRSSALPKNSGTGFGLFAVPEAVSRESLKREILQYGHGVPKDEIEALAWFNIAAITGHETAVIHRADLENHLGQQSILTAQQRSKEILKEIEAAKAKKSVVKP
jgi:TPR repeat protein